MCMGASRWAKALLAEQPYLAHLALRRRAALSIMTLEFASIRELACIFLSPASRNGQDIGCSEAKTWIKLTYSVQRHLPSAANV